MTYIISDYFKTNSLKFNINLDNFKKEKKVRSVVYDNRTICQMFRNLNVDTNFEYENEIVILIYYMELFITKLKERKDELNKMNELMGDKLFGYTQKQRSEFNKKRLHIVRNMNLLNIDNIFLKWLLNLYSKLNDKQKESIEEIAYYVYKLNLRMKMYEIELNDCNDKDEIINVNIEYEKLSTNF